MVLINRFAVYNGLKRLCRIGGAHLIIYRLVPAVAVLEHIKSEPFFIPKPLRRSQLVGLAVIGNKGLSAGRIHNGITHRAPNSYVLFAPRLPVAAQYPDDICLVFITIGQPFAVNGSILFIEYFGAFAPGAFVDLIAPGGQHGNVQLVFGSLVYYVIHMLKKYFSLGFVGSSFISGFSP